jgi:hypothetical protein
MSMPQHEVPLNGLAALGMYGMFFESLWRYGPSWGCVAPILFGTAAVVRTVNELRTNESKRQIEAEERKAEREARDRPFRPNLESLN